VTGSSTSSGGPRRTTAADVRFDPATGLVPTIVQESGRGRVLMLGYMNAAALERTRETGRVTFWSRSRDRLWEKGETSGNWLELRRIRTDCDADALLVEAVPHGPTCHTGRATCFDADPALGADGGAAARGGPTTTSLFRVLLELSQTIAARDRDRPAGSYTAELLAAAPALSARKVAEEAVEVAVAALAEPDRLAEESADLLYHLLVLWRAAGLPADDVAAVLESRARGEDP